MNIKFLKNKFILVPIIFIVIILILFIGKINSHLYYPNYVTGSITYPTSWNELGLSAAHNTVYGNGDLKTNKILKGYKQIFTGVSVVSGTAYFGTKNGVAAINVNTGKQLWFFKSNNEVMTQIIINHNIAYFGSGNRNFPKNIAKWSNAGGFVRGTGKSSIYAVNSKTGKLVWKINTKGENMPTFVYNKGTVYIANGNDYFYAINAKTGKIEWKINIKSFVSMSSPAIYKNLIVFGGDMPHNIYAINIKTHKIQWKKNIPYAWGGISDGSVAISDSTVYTVALEHNKKGYSQEIYALNIKNGKTRWTYFEGRGSLPKNFAVGIPTIYKNYLYVGSPVTNTIYKLNKKTGKLSWKLKVYSAIRSAPTIVNNPVPTLYVGDMQGNIYAINAKSAFVVGIYHLKGAIGPFTTTIIDNNLMIGTHNSGMLYFIPLENLYKHTFSVILYHLWSIFNS